MRWSAFGLIVVGTRLRPAKYFSHLALAVVAMRDVLDHPILDLSDSPLLKARKERELSGFLQRCEFGLAVVIWSG